MSRPLVALGLVAVALGLLATVFADVGRLVEDPRLEVSEKTAQTVADAAADNPESAADLMRLLGGADITLPEGTTIEGGRITLPEDVDWTLPAGTELENIDMTLPEGVGFAIPEGTEVDGDTLVFPEGSQLVLDDGTVLELPEGGTMTFPGLTEQQLAAAVAAGYIATQGGSRLQADRLRNQDDWPATLPAGTTFELPPGYRFEDGVLTAPRSITMPEGTEIRPASDGRSRGSGGSSLFDRVGSFDLRPDGSGAGLATPSLPGGSWWLWTVAGLALLGGAFFAWRHRVRLLALMSGLRTGAAAAPPVRLVWRVDDREAGLPLATAPGDTPRATLVVEARRENADNAEGPAPWTATAATVELQIGEAPATTLEVTPEGTAVPIPVLTAGDHPITARVRVPDDRRTYTLHDVWRVASWAEQIAHDYQDLADAAARTVGDIPSAHTPRLFAAALGRRIATDSAGLDRFVLLFERANYSQDTVGEAEWLAFIALVMRYRDALEGLHPPPAASTGADALGEGAGPAPSPSGR